MSEPWDALAEEVEGLFETAVEGFKDEVKAGAVEFLQDNAKLFAKYTWLGNTAETEEERNRHRATLSHLIAQASAKGTLAALAANRHAGVFLEGLIGVVGSVLEKLGPVLIKKAGL